MSFTRGSCTVKPTDSGRVLGVIISADMSFKQHISLLSALAVSSCKYCDF